MPKTLHAQNRKRQARLNPGLARRKGWQRTPKATPLADVKKILATLRSVGGPVWVDLKPGALMLGKLQPATLELIREGLPDPEPYRPPVRGTVRIQGRLYWKETDHRGYAWLGQPVFDQSPRWLTKDDPYPSSKAPEKDIDSPDQ